MSRIRLVALAAIGLILGGCDNDDEEISISQEGQINEWIYDVMDEVYYWTDELPARPDLNQSPEDFFEVLLSSEDRFSAIYPDYDQLINSLDGITLEAGYELALLRESSENENVIAAILYVKENSPAADAQLRRGDLIYQINGNQITLDNYRDLLGRINSNHSIEYRRFNYDTEVYEEFAESLTVTQVFENPILLDSVYSFNNGINVGYLVYNFFSSGVGESTEYDDQVRQVFSEFKSQSVNELVLDLRYNGGGSVTAATNLASLIAPNVSDNDIFYTYEWNDLLTEYWESQADSEAILRGNFENLGENIGANLRSNKVYVLVSGRTASASELVINGLLPYVDVEIIGETTVGKNVGSIPLEDDDNPDNSYGLLPIVFKIFNSNGLSDYDEGFIPDPAFQVEEFIFPLLELGNVNEPLLNTALNNIDPSLSGRRSFEYVPVEELVKPAKNEFNYPLIMK